MEARMFFGVMATLTALACASLGVYGRFSTLRRRIAAANEANPAEAMIAWRLRNGFRFALPAARLLLHIDAVRFFARECSQLLEDHGRVTTTESVTTLALVSMVAITVFTGVMARSLVGSIAVPSCVVALIVFRVHALKDKHAEEIRNSIPDAIDSMSVCFGSGFTLQQTFVQVSQDVGGPLGKVFARCAHTLEMGGTAESALSELKSAAHASELAFVAVALDVQHQSGGALKQVLGAAAETVKGELELRRSLRVQTAQAKLSARIVAIMPFLLVTAFSLVSPDFLLPFFSSVYGYGLLCLALTMMAAGIFMVKHALSVEGVA